ncbi:unnamed protein product [Schistosoma turkestanicum]|nr:unnamed protein product [Schistosoma turkestanicum]
MVFETHDVLKYLADMQNNLNFVKTTSSPLRELYANNAEDDRLSNNPLCNTVKCLPGQNSRQLENRKHRHLNHCTNEISNLPDNLKMIIDKTWKAYYEENDENISTTIKNTTYSSTQAICTCKADEYFNDSSLFPVLSTTSLNKSLGIDQLIVMSSQKNLAHASLQLHQSSGTERTTELRPRPLLRQKENVEPLSMSSQELNYTSTVIATNVNNKPKTVTSPSNLNITTNTHRPMQVHMRYPIPRKQDAIYNARYKTQPCLHYQKYKHCPLGDNCHFAHGPDELKYPQFHPKYRTRVCMNYANSGNCPFGRNCYFLHSTPTSLPSSQSTTLMHDNNHTIKRTATSSWTIDQYIQDDSSISSHNSYMDAITLSSSMRRVTI